MQNARLLKIDPFSPLALVLLFWVMEFLLPYGYLVSARPWEKTSSYASIISVSDINWAFGLAALYLFFLFIGYMHFGTMPRMQQRYRIERRYSFNAPRALILVFAALAIYVALYYLHPGRSASSRMELTSGAFGTLFFLWISVLFALLWIVGSEFLANFARTRSRTQLVLTSLLIFSLVIAFFPLGGRGRALVSILYLVVMWHYFVRPLNVITVCLVFLSGNVVVVLIAYLRTIDSTQTVNILELAFGLEYGRNFDRLLNFAVLLHVFEGDSISFHYGRAFLTDILSDLGFSLPFKDSRAIFMTEVLRMPSFLAGFPPSRPGEFYMAFGIPGVAAGGYLLGFVAHWLYRTFIIDRRAGTISVGIYFTLIFTGGFVQQTAYMFNKGVLTLVSAGLILTIAVLLFGYRIRRSSRKLTAQPSTPQTPGRKAA